MKFDIALAIMNVLLRYHGRLPVEEVDEQTLRAVLGDALPEREPRSVIQ